VWLGGRLRDLQVAMYRSDWPRRGRSGWWVDGDCLRGVRGLLLGRRLLRIRLVNVCCYGYTMLPKNRVLLIRSNKFIQTTFTLSVISGLGNIFFLGRRGIFRESCGDHFSLYVCNIKPSLDIFVARFFSQAACYKYLTTLRVRSSGFAVLRREYQLLLTFLEW
jgi:hypothetical protein